MHALQLSCLGQLGQVTPDCLRRHTKVFDQPLDGHFALASGDLDDFRLAKRLYHCSSRLGET